PSCRALWTSCAGDFSRRRSCPWFRSLDSRFSLAECFGIVFVALHPLRGHAYAVGFSLLSAHIAELRFKLDQYARTRMTPADLEPVLEISDELLLDHVSPALFESLCRLEPFGAGNHEPVFRARAVRLVVPPRIVKDQHAKLKLAPRLEGSNQKTTQG